MGEVGVRLTAHGARLTAHGARLFPVTTAYAVGYTLCRAVGASTTTPASDLTCAMMNLFS